MNKYKGIIKGSILTVLIIFIITICIDQSVIAKESKIVAPTKEEKEIFKKEHEAKGVIIVEELSNAACESKKIIDIIEEDDRKIYMEYIYEYIWEMSNVIVKYALEKDDLGKIANVVRDKDNKVIGKVIEDKLVDYNSNIIGYLTGTSNSIIVKLTKDFLNLKVGDKFDGCSITSENEKAGRRIDNKILIINPDYPKDAYSGASPKDWSYKENQADEIQIRNNLMIFPEEGHFATDFHKNAYLEGIVLALETTFPVDRNGNKIIYDKNEEFIQTIYERAIVQQPMGEYAPGVLRLNKTDGWYYTLFIPSIKMQEEMKNETNPIAVTPPATTITGNLILASGTINKHEFDVTKGIPSGEDLYVQVITEEYVAGYTYKTSIGSINYSVKVEGNYIEGNGSLTPFSEAVIVPRTYNYNSVDKFYMYKIKEVSIKNKVLESGMLNISPSDYQLFANVILGDIGEASIRRSTINIGNVASGTNLYSYANSMVGSIDSINDKLVINGVVTDAGDLLAVSPQINSDILYKTNIIIPKSTANIKDASTTATITYEKIYDYKVASNQPNIITKNITGNSITIHTPVVCYPKIENQISKVQVLNPDTSKTQLIIGDFFRTYYPVSGQHLGITGYGFKDYSSTTEVREIKLTFDVYEGTDNTGEFLEKNIWHIYLGESQEYYIPNWVDIATNAYVQFKTTPINMPENMVNSNIIEYNYNSSIDKYLAVERVDIELFSKIYDFKITGATDKNWIEYFKENPSNESGTLSLPIMHNKNTIQGYEDYAIKLGYEVLYEFKTNSDIIYNTDKIVISPTYYHIDKDGGNKELVDVYYESDHGFIALGGDKDTKENNMILNYLGRNIPIKELENTAYVFDELATRSTMDYENYLISLKGESEKDIKYNEFIYLTERQKTYIGAMNNLPNVVNKLELLSSEQQWYGEFYLPNQSLFVPVGTDLSSYSRLSAHAEPFFQDGYIIVNFDIKLYKDLDNQEDIINTNVYSKYRTNNGNGWEEEGYNLNQNNIDLNYGDVMVFHVDKKSSDDYQ